MATKELAVSGGPWGNLAEFAGKLPYAERITQLNSRLLDNLAGERI